jgi:hypothetical protein
MKKRAEVTIHTLREPVALTRDQERMRRRHGKLIAQSTEQIGRSLDSPREEKKHYSVAEVAKLWNLAPDTVRKIFAKMPGVLKIGTKGRYVTLRIPEQVLQRMTAQLSACRKPVR